MMESAIFFGLIIAAFIIDSSIESAAKTITKAIKEKGTSNEK